jgi:hypothetical protein
MNDPVPFGPVPQYCQSAPPLGGWLVWNLVRGWGGVGLGTLLGPEESGPDPVAPCLRGGGWGCASVFLGLLRFAGPCVGVGGGVGGYGSCELDSGREHLRQTRHHGSVAIGDRACLAPCFGGGGVGVVVVVFVVFVECL